MPNNKFLDILPQPDGSSCGPTCLHAVYRYFDDDIPLQQVIAEVPTLEDGGTLAVYLACHALLRGFKATIISYNLQIFDPTWATASSREIAARRPSAVQGAHQRFDSGSFKAIGSAAIRLERHLSVRHRPRVC
jgi:hypothetical protein